MNDIKKKNRRVSVRRHLPLAVRIHYDAVRNFAPVKIFGLAVMGLIGMLGLLLATQFASPQSLASTNGSSSNLCAPGFGSQHA